MNKQLSQLFEDGSAGSRKYSAEAILKNKKIIVYGAGNGFIAFNNTVLDRFNLLPYLVLDNKFKKGDAFNGIAAQSISGYKPSEEEKKNSIVVVTVGKDETYKTIRKSLKELGLENIIKSSSIFEFNLHHIPVELKEKGTGFYLQNRENIEAGMKLMLDKLSQEVFYAMMKTYITQRPGKIPSSPSYEQYFPLDINLQKGYSRFIDCGSYDGDTVRQLRSHIGRIDALACFEPDEKNYSLLSRYLKDNRERIAENIFAFPCGVFSREARLSFSGDKSLCSSISDDGNATIQCVALDDVIPNFKPTFISMDIEGAELEALEGAARLIRDNKPDLAISVYHFPNHLWEIPAYLNSLKLGYRFYLRNYTGFTYETILYASAGNGAKRCRVCKGKSHEKSLIRYRNMPRIAQCLPDKDTVKDDAGTDIEVYQCKFCGLIQLNSRPVPYYKQVIRSSGFSEEMKNYRWQQFKEFVNKYSIKDKKIIEIGCGNGEYLSIMQQFCSNSYGTEYSDGSVRKCKESGLNVAKGFIDAESYKLAESPFDAFFMMNFLEHFPEPNTALRGIYNNLSDDAVGLIEVPNFDMILDKEMFADFSTEHLSYFTKDTLASILELNGFDIIGIDVIWYESIISAVVRKKKRVQIADFIYRKELLEHCVENYLSQFGPKNVAIWGAGHQSLAIIALLNLKDKIKYVVDSATFKQGKFTPATHLPIVAPEKLVSEPVDAVIVIASSYSDEVAAILRIEYKHIPNVAILRNNGLKVIG